MLSLRCDSRRPLRGRSLVFAVAALDAAAEADEEGDDESKPEEDDEARLLPWRCSSAAAAANAPVDPGRVAPTDMEADAANDDADAEEDEDVCIIDDALAAAAAARNNGSDAVDESSRSLDSSF